MSIILRVQGPPLLFILFLRQIWSHNSLSVDVQALQDELLTIQHSKPDKLFSSLTVQNLARNFGHIFLSLIELLFFYFFYY